MTVKVKVQELYLRRNLNPCIYVRKLEDIISYYRFISLLLIFQNKESRLGLVGEIGLLYLSWYSDGLDGRFSIPSRGKRYSSFSYYPDSPPPYVLMA
jgi:hypothetical protein